MVGYREREVVGHRDDHYVLHEHILEHRYPHYINQQSLSLPSHTLTGFPQWLIHITCLKFGLVAFILAGSTHTTYCKTLQNALGMNARENVSLRMYICSCIYQASVTSSTLFFYPLFSGSTVAWYDAMECEVDYN